MVKAIFSVCRISLSCSVHTFSTMSCSVHTLPTRSSSWSPSHSSPSSMLRSSFDLCLAPSGDAPRDAPSRMRKMGEGLRLGGLRCGARAVRMMLRGRGGGGGFKDWKGLGNEGRVVKGCCRVWRGFPGPDYRLRVPEHCAVLCLPPEADTVNVFLSIVTSPPSIGRQVNARPVLSYGPSQRVDQSMATWRFEVSSRPLMTRSTSTYLDDPNPKH